MQNDHGDSLGVSRSTFNMVTQIKKGVCLPGKSMRDLRPKFRD